MSSLYQHLTPQTTWGERVYRLPSLQYPERLNAYSELIDGNIKAGRSERPAIHFQEKTITYGELFRWVNRIANALKKKGIQPGDRVMLRTWNNPYGVAAWLAIGKIGAVNVATMPLLRAREITYMANDAECKAVVCGVDLLDEIVKSKEHFTTVHSILAMGPNTHNIEDLSELSKNESEECAAADTSRGDVALIGYTSGSTGDPKGCVSFHDDVLAIADGYARHVLTPTPDDRFGGHPSLAFTFGLGALLVFPFRFGSQTVLLEKFTPQAMLDTLAHYKVSIAFCAPTCYRMMIDLDPGKKYDLSSLRFGVSAGETLPGHVFTRWKEERGIELLDGIGSTELLHIFITSYPKEARPGVTGRPAPGYEARVVDSDGNEMPRGEPGLLAVRGPTACRYWKKPERQAAYVKDGWNYPGDVFVHHPDGTFQYQCRNDDLIVTAGYNVAGIEVENVLLEHPGVKEAGVVGVDDELRGKVVKAFIVLKPTHKASFEMEEELKEWVKDRLAPYKYPRQIEFVEALPRTDTGKVQRFRLRQK